MKLHVLLMGILVILVLGVVYYSKQIREPFMDTNAPKGCPTSAQRTPDGTIKIEPSGKIFNTLPDYVKYLSDLYASGEKCVAPMVKPHREPIDGILGGLGNDVQSPSSYNQQGTTRDVLVSESGQELTSAKTPIRKLDDYEYSRVFESEQQSRNVLSDQTKNELLHSRILDWANLPFNSETRSQNENEFIAGRLDDAQRDPKTGIFFKTVEGTTLLPPDVEAEKLREQTLLASYRPSDISKHAGLENDTEAVAKLVHEMYQSDPNWEPVVSKTGENMYAVTELRPKPRKETYEDESTMKLSMAEGSGIVIPPPTMSIDDRLRNDPYFDKSGLGDRDNNLFWNYNDFRKWTPGLERMFAPTMDNKAWY